MAEKEKTLEEKILEINKELKLDSVQVAGSSKTLEIPRLSTGSLTYDVCTGGGFPVGRHTVLYGAESSGKTTVALMAMAQYFKTDDKRAALIIDAEYSFDKNYAADLGVDMNRVIIIQPDHLAEGDSVLRKCLEDNLIGFFLVDSIAALLPKSVIENEADASNIGKHAQAIGNMFKKSNMFVGKNKVTAIWVNQIRDKIGGYGGGISLPAGHAPKFYASIMIKVMRGSKVENKDGSFTNSGWIRVEKNKTHPPYKEGHYSMLHGKGICQSSEILDVGVSTGVLYKKGHSYYYDDTFKNDEEDRKNHVMIGRGKQDAIDFLNDNIELREELYKIIIDLHFLK